MSTVSPTFFRREYARLVAGLSRRFGVEVLELAEDAASTALLRAVETWPRSGEPRNPSAWLWTVAHNALMGELRTRGNRARLLASQAGAEPSLEPSPRVRLGSEIDDDQLRMLFVCCDPDLAIEAQLALALKTLCGLSVAEIAQRTFSGEAAVYKRLARARKQLAAQGRERMFEAGPESLGRRRPAVQATLYLLFTEGHLSTHPELAIRRELCSEAIRLGVMLARHEVGDPSSSALVALMFLHRARLSARTGEGGGLLLLSEQDRSAWNPDDIAEGMRWLAASASGDVLTRYHLEAGIAAEHAMAPSLEATHWERIATLYEQLEAVSRSPLHRLNRALALAQWRGAEAGLELVRDRAPPTWLEGSVLWSATLADLCRRAGEVDEAAQWRAAALASAPSEAVRELLLRRLAE